jgi:hypothetical protein
VQVESYGLVEQSYSIKYLRLDKQPMEWRSVPVGNEAAYTWQARSVLKMRVDQASGLAWVAIAIAYWCIPSIKGMSGGRNRNARFSQPKNSTQWLVDYLLSF